jgi:RNase P protein component
MTQHLEQQIQFQIIFERAFVFAYSFHFVWFQHTNFYGLIHGHKQHCA